VAGPLPNTSVHREEETGKIDIPIGPHSADIPIGPHRVAQIGQSLDTLRALPLPTAA